MKKLIVILLILLSFTSLVSRELSDAELFKYLENFKADLASRVTLTGKAIVILEFVEEIPDNFVTVLSAAMQIVEDKGASVGEANKWAGGLCRTLNDLEERAKYNKTFIRYLPTIPKAKRLILKSCTNYAFNFADCKMYCKKTYRYDSK